MALVVFGEKIDFTSITLPEEGGYVVGYDINTDLLSQMDYLGNVTIIGTLGGGAPLSTTLGLGNSTGTYSIVLDSSITMGTNKILLDDSRVSITTANGNYSESYLYMNSTDTILGNGSSKSFRIESTGIITKWSDTDKQTINTSSYELFLNNLNTLQFGKLSSGAGSKLSALISTDNSTIGNGLVNTVVIGGQNISALESNSVYVPYLLIQDGKVIKGTKGSGQIQFTETGDVISSNSNSVIGVISSTSSITFTQNGIFVKDSATASNSPNIDNGITYVSTRNSSATASIKNSVVIGGQGLIATADDTVYLGNNVNINNAFTLPMTDGSIGQVLKTDGVGNVTWGGVAATLNLVSLDYSTFVTLGGVFEVDTTYVITDADASLYGGTEIYLTTNSNGVLNDEGIGKFYNPNYNSTPGFGIFSTSSTGASGSIVFWGGYTWQNSTGVRGTASDIYTLDLNWTKIPFDEIYYTISYDKIKYDWQNDLIVYRNEKNTNIVSTSKSNISYWIDLIGYNPIKSFQWGNIYDFISAKGIGSQNIINSYNENINFRGISQNNITMNNLSAQYNLSISTSDFQENIIFNNYIYDRQSITITSETGLVFQGDLPNTTPSKLMGKINNQQVEIDLTAIGVGGSGVTNSIPKWTNPSTLGNSNISDNGDTITINANLMVIGTTSTIRTGVLIVGTGSIANSRFIVSSSGGTVSLVVDEFGNVYNRGRGNISTNTAFGSSALSKATTGYSTTAIGVNALLNNTTGIYNTAIGANSLYSSNGDHNTAIGSNSLYLNTNGRENTALGNQTLYNNTTGGYNTAVGYQSLFNNTIGLYNTAVGKYTLYNNTNGEGNTSFGHEALYLNNGSYNTALGYHAGYSATNSSYSIFIGYYVDATSSDYSNFLGYFAGFETQNSPRTNIIGNYAGFQSSNSNNSNFIGNYAGFQSPDSNSANCIGDHAGLQSPGSTNSNFIGFHAGAQSPNVKNSNFIGESAGKGAPYANNSNFFGNYAGQGAAYSDNSNFFGESTGKDTTYTSHSNFLGAMAGREASGASYSNFMGYGAGKNALNSHNSNFFGSAAGGQAINVSYSNFFGNNAGQDADNASNSNFIGERAGKGAINSNNSNFLGQGAGQGATNSNNSNFIGSNSGLSSYSNNSNFFGQNSGEFAQLAHHSNFIGFYAGAGANDAINSNFFGYAAGQNAIGAFNSNLFGFSAGKSFTSNVIGSNNIVIGTNISLPNGATNSINIGGVLFGLNTYSNAATDPSIVAQTDGRIGINVVSPTTNLHVYGTQPGAFRLEDGTQANGYVLTSDATGVASWTASRPYEVYTAILTRTGATGPSASVLENTLGTITYNYNGVGLYSISSSGLFTLDKTIVFVQNNSDGFYGNVLGASRVSNNQIDITQTTGSGLNDDDWGTPVSIEIRVYN